MRLLTALVAAAVIMGCAQVASSGAEPPVNSVQRETTVSVTLSDEQARALSEPDGGGMALVAEFTLTGVEAARDLPAGVVRIGVAGEPDATLAIVDLQSPFAPSDPLSRAVTFDLGAALSPEQIRSIAAQRNLTLTFEVEAPETPRVGIEAPAVRFE